MAATDAPTNDARWATSSDGVLGLLASNDLLFRAAAEIPWRRLPELLDLLRDSVLATLVLSILAEFSETFGLLAVLTQWLLLFYLFVLLTPRLYLSSARPSTSSLAFKFATATTGLGFTFTISSFLSPAGSMGTTAFVTRFVGVVVAGGTLFGACFSYGEQWNQLNDHARVDLLQRFIPVPADARRELLAGFAAGGGRARLERLAWKSALVIVALVPAFLLGTFAAFGTLLFPLIEVTVLGALVVRRWEPTVPWVRALFGTDVEARLYAAVRYAGRGVKGMTLLLLAFIGLLLPVILFAGTVAAFVQSLWATLLLTTQAGVFTGSTIGPIHLWNLIGVFTTLLLSVGFQLWFWLRMLGRVPHYLTAWERRGPAAPGYAGPVGRAAVTGADLFDPHYLLSPPPFYHRILDRVHTASVASPVIPTRPVGSLVVPMVTVVVTAAYVTGGEEALAGSYPFVWPALSAVLLASVYLTFHQDPQPVTTDTAAFPAALMVQVGGYFLITNPLELAARSGFDRLGGPDGALSAAVIVLLSVPWLFFFGDVVRYGRHHSGLRRYAIAGYLIGFGGAGLGLGRVASGWGAASITALSISCCVAGLLVALGIWMD